MEEFYFARTKKLSPTLKICFFLLQDWAGIFDSQLQQRIKGTLLGIELFTSANRPIEECFFFMTLTARIKIAFGFLVMFFIVIKGYTLYLEYHLICFPIYFVIAQFYAISQIFLGFNQYLILKQHLTVLCQKDYYIYRNNTPTKIEEMVQEIIHGRYRIHQFSAATITALEKPTPTISQTFENFKQSISAYLGLVNVFKSEQYLNAFNNLDATQKGIAIYCLHSSGCICNEEKAKLISLFNLGGDSFQRAIGNPYAQYKKTDKFEKNFDKISSFLSKDNDYLMAAMTDLCKIWDAITEENHKYFQKNVKQ